MRRRWGVGLAALAALAAGGVWLKGYVLDELGAALTERAAARGFTASHGAVRWTGGAVTIEGVQLGRPGAALRLAEVRVELGLDDWSVRPRRVWVSGLAGTVDPVELSGRAGGLAVGGREGAGAAYGEVAIELTDVAVRVPEVGVFEGEVHGTLRDLTGTVSWRSARPEAPGVHVFDVRVHGRSVAARPRGGLAVRRGPLAAQVTEVSLRRRARDGWGVGVALATAAWPGRFTLRGGTVRLTPGDRALRLIGGVVALERPDPGAAGVGGAETPGGGLDLGDLPALSAADVRIETPFAHPHVAEAEWRDGVFTAHGESGGGTFSLYAEIPVGLRPSALAVELDGVTLSGPDASGQVDLRLFAAAEGPLGRAWPAAAIGDLVVSRGALGQRWFGEPLTDLAGFARFGVRVEPGRVEVDHLVAGHGALVARGSGGWADDALGGRVRLSAKVDSVDCQAAVDAIPPSLLGAHGGITATGTYAPTLRLDLPIGRPEAVKIKARGWTRRCTFTGMAGTRGPSPDVTVGDAPADLTDVTWLRERFAFRVRAGVDGERVVRVGPAGGHYVALGRLPGYVGGAAYLTEEMNFWKGGAFSPGLLARALATNLGTGRYTYGGSTITQQLVKNLVLAREKTLLRKLREIFVAARVTDALPKARILELYLNCIEFGPNVFGVGRAARRYFQKDPALLTPREAIFLAMLKPAPRRGGGYVRRGHEPDFPWWKGRVVQVAGRLRDAGLISGPQYAEAIRGRLTWVDGRYVGAVDPGAPPAPDEGAADAGVSD